MALPDTSITIPDAAAGVEHALMTVGGKVYPVAMIADDSGHIQQTLPTYLFCIPNVAGAAAKIHFDLFNAIGSGKVLELRGLWGTPVLTTAVTGLVSPDFDLIRTSAVGTGGTVLSFGSATLPSIAPMDDIDVAPPATVTMRNSPTAGATSQHALFRSYLTQEETQAGAQLGQWYNMIPDTVVGRRITCREGKGFKLVQNTLGVAQNWSWLGIFTLT